MEQSLVGFLLVIGVIVFYMAPAITAHSRRHNNASAITLLTVLAGWTVIGWIIAAVWAHTNDIKK